MNPQNLIVNNIQIEKDRVLLFGSDPNYHIIAPIKTSVNAGGTIEYEDGGVNFGWFKRLALKDYPHKGE
jgi:hypothetical protein